MELLSAICLLNPSNLLCNSLYNSTFFSTSSTLILNGVTTIKIVLFPPETDASTNVSPAFNAVTTPFSIETIVSSEILNSISKISNPFIGSKVNEAPCSTS